MPYLRLIRRIATKNEDHKVWIPIAARVTPGTTIRMVLA
jgi:hypothetical protein